MSSIPEFQINSLIAAMSRLQQTLNKVNLANGENDFLNEILDLEKQRLVEETARSLMLAELLGKPLAQYEEQARQKVYGKK